MLETDLDLVLHKPQHYHVTLFAYEDMVDSKFTWSTEYELIANDIHLAVDRAKRLSSRPKTWIKGVRQCADPDHLEGLD